MSVPCTLRCNLPQWKKKERAGREEGEGEREGGKYIVIRKTRSINGRNLVVLISINVTLLSFVSDGNGTFHFPSALPRFISAKGKCLVLVR
jgi:hypothetical protein